VEDRDEGLCVPWAVVAPEQDRAEAPADSFAVGQELFDDGLLRMHEGSPSGEDEWSAQAFFHEWQRRVFVADRTGPVERSSEDEDHLVGHQAAVHPPLNDPWPGVAGCEGPDEDLARAEFEPGFAAQDTHGQVQSRQHLVGGGFGGHEGSPRFSGTAGERVQRRGGMRRAWGRDI
jgi:hypothetical protein